MGLMPVTESMFMVPESREQPMHVGSLQLFDLPEDAGDGYLRELYERSIALDDVAPVFRKRPYRSVLTGGQWAWRDDAALDLEHHVRHSALPEPGRVRELLALASRLHGTLLDRKRPLWEAHLIEGLEGRRFAVYTKLHHAMMDGVSGLRLLQRSLSTDPDERDTPVLWAPRPDRRPRKAKPGLVSQALAFPTTALQLTTDAVTLTPTLLRLAEQGLREQATVLPGQAPHTILNERITGSRRFAAESWSLDRIRAVASRYDATVNDVVLAMCSGALRQYLLELDALPGSSLVAMTPVSLRKDDGEDEAGNAVGTILCNLGTDIADPEARLLAVRTSMRRGKQALAGLSQPQATAIGALVMAPLLLASLGLHRLTPPPYNLVISNVPGPQEPLYWNGARLAGIYPLSIPTHGQALNITVTSYAGSMEFGLTGCRRTVPRLQRLLRGLDESLAALEEAG